MLHLNSISGMFHHLIQFGQRERHHWTCFCWSPDLWDGNLYLYFSVLDRPGRIVKDFYRTKLNYNHSSIYRWKKMSLWFEIFPISVQVVIYENGWPRKIGRTFLFSKAIGTTQLFPDGSIYRWELDINFINENGVIVESQWILDD